MKVEDYLSILHEDISLASKAEGNSEDNEFLNYVAGMLINAEEFDDFTECHFEGVTRRNGKMRIDGYSLDESDNSCCIFISDYRGASEETSIYSDDINNAFRKLRFFVEESIDSELYREINGSLSAVDFSRDLYYDNETIAKFRFFLLTDAFNKQRTKNIKDDNIHGKPVELNVWDVNRLFELVLSNTQKESVEIVLDEFGYNGIPCVKAVDYRNVTADIDISPVYDDESAEEKTDLPDNIVTYSSYLAVVPGQLLNDLYLEYGSKLLEGNVRSFLSVRGKVNKSIQATIKNYPEMFFAYNNGIAATATEVDTARTENGLIITRIKDLQIVNGGQTTASIANAILTAKKTDNIDISNLYVPMKLSVLEHSMAERIIPKISEYSNSQNKVEASDFFSNHPFHIRMEEYSRKTPVPSRGGKQYQQYWFYERTRGQYNQGKMKIASKPSLLKQYSEKYPEKMVIKMVDLAKYMEIYEGNPHIVSKGKQKMLQVFAENIKKEWDKSNEQYNAFYYKRVIALAILYNKTDEIIKQSEWYKDTHSYKANVNAYALSILFDHIHRNVKGYELDFNRLWNYQDIYDELREQLSILTREIYNYITGPRETENVTEWCKKELCWKKALTRSWSFTDEFVNSLVSLEGIQNEFKEEKTTRKVVNEVMTLKEVMARGPEYWSNVLAWGKQRGLLMEKEESILRMIINMNITGRIPTDKQINVVIKARERMISNGMPLQF